MNYTALEALDKTLTLPGETLLDVGAGHQYHSNILKQQFTVYTNDIIPNVDYCGDFLSYDFPQTYDIIWCSHVLEHQINPGAFLTKIHSLLNDGGYFVVTVPPSKPELVGGHVQIYNTSTLVYQLVVSGFNCRNIMLKQYGYNISAIVQKHNDPLPILKNDFGDIKTLEAHFPLNVKHGDIIPLEINW